MDAPRPDSKLSHKQPATFTPTSSPETITKSIGLDFSNDCPAPDIRAEHENILLAALVASPKAREKFTALRVGTKVFSDAAMCGVAASVLKFGASSLKTLNITALLNEVSVHGRRLRDALDTRVAMLNDPDTGEVREDWAVNDTCRCVCSLAGAWLPDMFKHALTLYSRASSQSAPPESQRIYQEFVASYMPSFALLAAAKNGGPN